MKRKIILDCDPGHDDAIAILLAGNSDKLDLLAVTTSSGNQTIEKTSKNAYNVCRYLGIDVPVAKGLGHPIIRDVENCSAVHGESGLDGFEFPKYDYNFDKRGSVCVLIDELLNNDDVTIIATGPMTNVAMALRLKPEIKDHIKEIIFMGGTIDYGNVSPAAEFNILCDPEAAYIVLTSGLPVKMIGLNVTRQVLVDETIIERMKKINNNASKLFVDLMITFLENQRRVFNLKGAPLHDPVTIVTLLDTNCVKYEKMNVEIDISHGPSYGRTNCDVFSYLQRQPNCEVAMSIDVDKYWDIIESSIRGYMR